MARLTIWQLGLGEALFQGESDMDMCDPDTLVGGIDDMHVVIAS
jgi:hypothetical protein